MKKQRQQKKQTKSKKNNLWFISALNFFFYTNTGPAQYKNEDCHQILVLNFCDVNGDIYCLVKIKMHSKLNPF